MLVANPDVDCMVGFYSCNPPRICEALRDASRLGEITVVGFDEADHPRRRQGRLFAGTVVQQPQ